MMRHKSFQQAAIDRRAMRRDPDYRDSDSEAIAPDDIPNQYDHEARAQRFAEGVTLVSKVEKLKAQQAKDLARAEREDALEPHLPAPAKGAFTYAHGNHVSVRVGDRYRPTFTLAEALDILAAFGEPIEAEHRKDSCLSIRPFECYSDAERDKLCLERVSSVGIETDSSSGGPSLALVAWFKVGSELCEVEIPFAVSSLHSATPTEERDAKDRKTGRLLWRGIGEDFRVNWWSPQGTYKSVYYWETFESFKSWRDLKAKERADHG